VSRSVTHIRDDIERLVSERADVYRRQQGAYVFSDDLAGVRAGLDARLRMLWEELRGARADRLRVGELSAVESWVLVSRLPRMAFA